MAKSPAKSPPPGNSSVVTTIITTSNQPWSLPVEIHLFNCERHHGGLRLTTHACAQSWQAHRQATGEARFHPCHACAIGAENAGCPVPSAPVHDRSCCICHRTGRRLVCRLFCVSCTNRLYEIFKNKWRRNACPGLASRLRSYSVEFEESA